VESGTTVDSGITTRVAGGGATTNTRPVVGGVDELARTGGALPLGTPAAGATALIAAGVAAIYGVRRKWGQ
jgi:hypothetical protein